MNVILNICPRDFRMNRLMILLLAMVAVAAAMPPMWCGRVILMPDKPHEANVTGELTLIQPKSGGQVRVQGTIRGLTPGLHGFHVHEKGDLSNGCTSAGAHFNPTQMDHGGPNDSERHVGDLGNIEANEDGVANVDIRDSVISLHGDQSILGRAIVVHAKEDNLGFGHDEASRTTGDSGSRLACGVIGLLK